MRNTFQQKGWIHGDLSVNRPIVAHDEFPDSGVEASAPEGGSDFVGFHDSHLELSADECVMN